MSTARNLKSQDLALLVILAAASFYIVSQTFLGINGWDSWRQADVLSQIYGFLHFKDILPFHDFHGRTAIYDIPIYEFLIAKLAVFFKADPLIVTRYVNLSFFLILCVYGYKFSEMYQRGAGIFFVFLIATSPVFLHYYAVPLPDTAAIALCMIAIDMAIRMEGLIPHLAAAVLFSVAALIKSPIPFVFLTYYACHIVAFQRTNFFNRRRLTITALLFFLAFLSAIGAELIRRHILGTDVAGFAQNPRWYFGSWSLRTSPKFWSRLLNGLLDSFAYRAIGWGFLFLSISYLVSSKRRARTGVPLLIAFFSGWLVFSNVYYVQIYYNLPALVFIYMLMATACATVLEWSAGAWRFNKDCLSRNIAKCRDYLLPVLACSFVVYMHHGSALRSPNFFQTLAYALRNTNHFLYVSPGTWDHSPAIGGYARATFTRIPLNKLNADCNAILHSNSSILVNGWSSCLAAHADSAQVYMEETLQWPSTLGGLHGKFQLYVAKPSIPKPIPTTETRIRGLPASPFAISYGDNTITYSKKACSKKDLAHTFFLHVYYENSGKFKSMDFKPFNAIHRTANNICIIQRRIPGHPIFLTTGQYSFRKNKQGKTIYTNYWGAKITLVPTRKK